MERTFTRDEAEQLLASVRAELSELIRIRADLATQAHAHNAGEEVSIADIKAMEARMSEILDGLTARGVQVKGYAPILLDFPMQVGDRTVLLCWLEGEDELGWYHELSTGFMGRRPLTELHDG